MQYKAKKQIQNKNCCTLLVLIPLLILPAFSCISREVWSINKEELVTRLANSDYELLKDPRLLTRNPKEAHSLGKGASFYIGRIFADLGLDDLAINMLIESYNHDKGIWREESAVLLMSALKRQSRHTDIERYAREGLVFFKKEENRKLAWRAYSKALFIQGKHEELLRQVDKIPSDSELKNEPEIRLYRAASIMSLGKPDSALLFISVFLGRADNEVYSEASALISSSLQTNKLPPLLEKLSKARDSITTGLASSGYAAMADACLSIDCKENSLQGSLAEFIEEISLWHLSEKTYSKGIAFLSEMLKRLDCEPGGSPRLMALEMLGRLYKKAGLYDKAQSLLSEVVSKTGSKEQYDRALWFRLDGLLESGSKTYAQELSAASRTWGDPEYFEDILEKTINSLVSERKWAEIKSLDKSINENTGSRVTARIRSGLAYITGRLVMLGKIASSDIQGESKRLFETAASAKGANYYSFMASSQSGKLPPILESIKDAGSSASAAGTASETDEYVLGFFDFGLVDAGLNALRRNLGALADDTVFGCLKLLYDRSLLYDTIRVANRIAYNRGYELSRELAIWQYPKGYSMLIEEQAKNNSIDSFVFYGLVREESAFNPNIVSRSGAVGLSQLMPETAKEQAHLLKIADYDLSDPKTNLSIGSYYLKRLLKTHGNVIFALIAYNAGSNRFKEWQKQFQDLPADILIEAVPFFETRNYVRKVVASSILYGFLYEGLPLEKTLPAFFPEMEK